MGGGSSRREEMKLDYKYITMIKKEDKPKTSVFDVYTKSGDTVLGEIKWFPRWRQYCFFPEDDCVFSKGCMADINDFMDEQMKIRGKEQK